MDLDRRRPPQGLAAKRSALGGRGNVGATVTGTLHHQWARVRSRTLVVACSDGRLQGATDAFLADELGLTDYDRLYIPGGGGALAASGLDFIRAQQLRGECRYLV